MALLLQLARQAVQAILGGAGRRAIAGGVTGGVAGGELAERFNFFGAGGPAIDGIGPARRRRRRKALTSDDLKLALTIASAVSKKAAENFILSRTRAS